MTFFVETPKENLLGNKITSKGFATFRGTSSASVYFISVHYHPPLFL